MTALDEVQAAQERVSFALTPQRITDLVAGRSTWEGVARE